MMVVVVVVVVIEAAELPDVGDGSRRLTWGCQDAREGCHQTCVLCPYGVVVRDQVQHVWVSQLAASSFRFGDGLRVLPFGGGRGDCFGGGG